MRTIFLCGFMGSGKSEAGKIAAQRLNLPFIDLDQYIEQMSENSIAEIFTQSGEEAFRQMETIAVAMICGLCDKGKTHIVALGGGTVVSELNAGLINRYGVSVFIDVDFDICYSRIKRDLNRPLVQGKSYEYLEKLYSKRKEIYLNAAQYTIDGNTDINTLAKEIVQIYAHI